jgi:hypothetical protein
MTEWDLINDDDVTLRFDNQDRDVSVYATQVSTSSGEVWSCSLYQREVAYGNGEHIGSTVAEERGEIKKKATELLQENT